MTVDVVTSTYDTAHEPLALQLADRVHGLRAFAPGRVFVAGPQPPLTAGMRELAPDVAVHVRVVAVAAHTPRGAAVRAALAAALAESDADSFAMMNLNRKVAMRDLERAASVRARTGCDVVVGSRRPGDGGRAEGRGALGDLKSAAWSAVVASLLPALAGVRDPSAPLKLMNRRAAALVVEHATVDGIAFDVDWLALWIAAGLTLEVTPIRWSQAPGSRPPWGAVLAMVRDVARLRTGRRAAETSSRRTEVPR